jgi:hypothetical protein
MKAGEVSVFRRRCEAESRSHFQQIGPVIRLNYAEPVARTDSANAPRVSDFAVRVVAAAETGGRHRFDLVGFSLLAAVSPQVLPLPNMRSLQ